MATPTVELDGQYRVLREECGFAERPELRLRRASGPDATEYVHDQLTNDVTGLAPGEGCYAALLDRKGHMRSDLRVLRVAADELLLICDAEGRDALGAHLGTYRVGRDVDFEKLDESHVVVSVVGPATARALGGSPLGAEHDHDQRELVAGGVPARVVTTDTGADVVIARADAERLRGALAGAGAEEVEGDALEIIRVETGRPRFGREMTTATIPQEAGLNERAIEAVMRLAFTPATDRHGRPVDTWVVVRVAFTIR